MLGIKIIKSFHNEKNIWITFLNSCKEYTKKQVEYTKPLIQETTPYEDKLEAARQEIIER